jgi:hypothetical protein
MTNGSDPRRGIGPVISDLAPKLLLTLFAAGISALLIPWITGKWQDHKQQIELRTALASDMSRAYTGVVVNGGFVAGGLVYSGSTSKVVNTAASQSAWTTALHDWLVESGRLTAELTGRYPGQPITREWREFAAAVTAYMRIGSQQDPAERTALLAQEQAYVGARALEWPALRRNKGFKSDPRFRASYTRLGNWLIARGDRLVQEELTLDPRV